MEEIAVINLQDLDEILMISPVLRSIKKDNPSSHITLLMDRKNSEAPSFIGNVDDFLFFDQEAVVDRLSNDRYSLVENHEYIKEQLKEVVSKSFDLVINVSDCRIGGIVASMFKTETVKGLMFDEYGHKWIEDPWFNYLSNVKLNNNYNLFHLIDIFASGSGYFRPGENFPELVFSKDVENRTKKVVLDISDNTGLELEKVIGSSYKDYSVVTTSYVNGTAELVSTMNQSSVLISSNRVSSMIASSLGLKVIFLSTEPNDYITHGPYGNGHIVVSKTSSNFNPKDILTVFDIVFCKGERSKLSDLDLYISFSRFDRDGFLEYVPLIPVDLSEVEFYRWVYRAVWKCTIGRDITAGDPRRFLALGEKYIDRVVDIDREVEYTAESIFSRYNHASIRDVIKSLKSDGINKLKNLAFEGVKAAKEFLASVAVNGRQLNEIKIKREGIKDIDSSIFKMAQEDSSLTPLINSFKHAREDLHVRNLFPLAKNIILTFEDLFSRASFMEEIVKGLVKRGENE